MSKYSNSTNYPKFTTEEYSFKLQPKIDYSKKFLPSALLKTGVEYVKLVQSAKECGVYNESSDKKIWLEAIEFLFEAFAFGVWQAASYIYKWYSINQQQENAKIFAKVAEHFDSNINISYEAPQYLKPTIQKCIEFVESNSAIYSSKKKVTFFELEKQLVLFQKQTGLFTEHYNLPPIEEIELLQKDAKIIGDDNCFSGCNIF